MASKPFSRFTQQWLALLLVGFATFAFADSPTEQESAPEPQRFAYVIGASVSMGFNLNPFGSGHSPSLYVLSQMGYGKKQIVKKTVITGSFKRKFKWLRKKLKQRPPEIILGLDLFHHDVRKKDTIDEKTYTYFNELLALFAETEIPVVVGTTWTRFENEHTIDEMNNYLKQKQAEIPNLYLFPAGEILDGVTKEGGVYHYQVNGVDLTLTKEDSRHFLLDVVHPNNKGARLMGNVLIQVLNEEVGIEVPYYDISDVVEMLENK